VEKRLRKNVDIEDLSKQLQNVQWEFDLRFENA
jgi:hypothetical protein